jgi:hypothetical protein
VMVAGLSACGGGGNPREYVLTLVNEEKVAGANAKCPGAPDPNVDISTPFNNDGDVFVYQGDATHWYLDNGSRVLEGTLTSGTFTFKYDETFEDRDNQNPTSPHYDDVKSKSQQIQFKEDGSNITGTYSAEDKETCAVLTNDNINWCQGFLVDGTNAKDCITSGSIQGVRLPDPKFVQATSNPGSNNQ